MAPPQAEEIHRRLSDAVIDMINEFRLQRAAGPLPDKALDQIIFRAAHSIVQVLGPYTRDERNVLWPSLLRVLLASFIREIGIADTMRKVAEGDDWLPTPANVNALPEGIRRYIHDLQTRCDPADDVQRMALQADTISGLDAKVRELQGELAAIRQQQTKNERRKGQ